MTSPRSVVPSSGSSRPARPVPAELSAPEGPALGRGSLSFRVAPGLGLALTGMDPVVAAGLGRRFRAFAAEGQDLRIRISGDGSRGFLSRRDDAGQGIPEVYRVEAVVDGSRVRTWSYAFAGEFPLTGSGEGRLILARDSWEPADRSVENFVRVVLAFRAPSIDGLVLHASAVARAGGAYVFLGPSGAGKSTAARLSHEAESIADDLCLVCRAGSGYRVSGLPLRSGESEGAVTDRSWPLRAFLRLAQDREVGLEPLPPARAVAELVASVPFVSEAKGVGTLLLDQAGPLAQRVPGFRLRFRKDGSFWRAVDGAAL